MIPVLVQKNFTQRLPWMLSSLQSQKCSQGKCTHMCCLNSSTVLSWDFSKISKTLKVQRHETFELQFCHKAMSYLFSYRYRYSKKNSIICKFEIFCDWACLGQRSISSFFCLKHNILKNIIRKIKVKFFKIYYSGLSGWLSAVRDSTQIDWALAKITLSLTECYSGQHSDKYCT